MAFDSGANETLYAGLKAGNEGLNPPLCKMMLIYPALWKYSLQESDCGELPPIYVDNGNQFCHYPFWDNIGDLIDKWKVAGVEVERKTWDNMPHYLKTVIGLIQEEEKIVREAQEHRAGFWKRTLELPP